MPALARRVAVVGLLLLLSASVGAAPPPPVQVASPSPADGSTAVPVTTALSWAASARALHYDVFLGTALPLTRVSAAQTALTFQPPALTAGVTYLWRVDAKNQGGTTTGVTWSFTTAAAPPPPPAAPANPSPASGATGVGTASTVLSWGSATGATSYDVAFGTTTPPPLVSPQQAGTQFNPGALAASTTYYWQVTARNASGSTPGPVWLFTTAPSVPPTTALRRLKLLTWNVQHGFDATNTEIIDDQVALMVDSHADVIGLQEITIEQGKDLSTLYKAKLEAATGRTWNSLWAPAPRAAIYTPEGNLILTPLPVVSSSTAAFDTMPGSPDMIGSKRAAAQVELIVNNRPVNIIVTHLDTDVTTRGQQLRLLMDWAQTFAAPRIVGGDFNMMPTESDHELMAAQFPDAWTTLVSPYQSTPEPGYTKDARGIAPWTGQPGRIDYWFHEMGDTRAVPTEIAVLKTRRSDHNALLMWVDVR